MQKVLRAVLQQQGGCTFILDCIQMYKPLTLKEEQAVKTREAALKGYRAPIVERIEEWYRDYINKVKLEGSFKCREDDMVDNGLETLFTAIKSAQRSRGKG